MGQLEGAEEQVLGLERDEDADDGCRLGHVRADLGAQIAEDALADPAAETSQEFFIAGAAAAVGVAIGAEVVGRVAVALVLLVLGVEVDFVVFEVVPA